MINGKGVRGAFRRHHANWSSTRPRWGGGPERSYPQAAIMAVRVPLQLTMPGRMRIAFPTFRLPGTYSYTLAQRKVAQRISNAKIPVWIHPRDTARRRADG